MNAAESDVPLVLLPGTLCDERLWEPMRQAWSGNAPRTVMTPCINGQRSAADMARSLWSRLPERCAVLGFSLGGIVALEMAAQAPERMAALAIVASNARPDLPQNEAARKTAVQVARRDGMTKHLQRDLWPSYVASHRLQERAILNLVVQMAEDSGTDIYMEQAEIAIHRADSRPRLAGFTMPTLIVSAEQDVLNPQDRQTEMLANLPRADWLEVAACGHFVPLEAPEALAEAVLTWYPSALTNRR